MCPVQLQYHLSVPDGVYGIVYVGDLLGHLLDSVNNQCFEETQIERVRNIVMRLNVVKKELFFDINEGEYRCLMRESDGLKIGKCKLMIHFPNRNDAMTLRNFTIKHR